MQDLFCQLPCIKEDMSILRPEDNVDNDTIVLNKHSVVKKSQLAKGDMMDGLTVQNNRFKLAGNQEIIYCMLYKSILSIKQSNGRNCTGEFHFFAIIF